MKKIIAVILTIALIMSFPLSAAAESRFSDVDSSAWYAEAVDYVVSKNLFNGITDTTFEPQTAMSRAMFVTVLGRKSNVDITLYPGTSFTDVPGNTYFSPYVQWAYYNGLVDGVGNYKFNPNGKITREQMASILFAYAGKTGNNVTSTAGAIDSFPDGGNVASWATAAMDWAISHEVINGSNGRLDPKGSANRAQVAQLLMNADALLANTATVDEQFPPEPSKYNTDDPNFDWNTVDPADLVGWEGIRGITDTPYIRRVRAILDPMLEEIPRYGHYSGEPLENAHWDERALQGGWTGPKPKNGGCVTQCFEDGWENSYENYDLPYKQVWNEENIVAETLYHLFKIRGGYGRYFLVEVKGTNPDPNIDNNGIYIYYG